MKKTTILLIFTLILFNFTGCGKHAADALPDNSSNTAFPTPDNNSNDDEFCLIQQEITIECGTQLGELEDYVIGNTDKLTSKLTNQPSDGRAYYLVPGTYWLEITNRQTNQFEKMKVIYVDTTPPAVTYDTDTLTVYCLQCNLDYGNSLLWSADYDAGSHSEDWIISLAPICLDERNFGMQITDLSTDPFEKDYTTYWKEFDFPLLPWNVLPIDYEVLQTEGIHDITLTVTDDNGNSADYAFKLDVLYEIDPRLREGYENEWDYILTAVEDWRTQNPWITGNGSIPAELNNYDAGIQEEEIIPDMGDTAGHVRFTNDEELFLVPGETLPLYAIDIWNESLYRYLSISNMTDVTTLEYVDGSCQKTDDTVSLRYHIAEYPEYDLYMEYHITDAYWDFALFVR